jgi:hypothetical protein
VVAEPKEQSLSAADVAEEEDAGAAAAAQPDSRARATVARGIGQDEVMVGQGETRPAPSK